MAALGKSIAEDDLTTLMMTITSPHSYLSTTSPTQSSSVCAGNQMPWYRIQLGAGLGSPVYFGTFLPGKLESFKKERCAKRM